PAEYDALIDLIRDAEAFLEARGSGVFAQQREAQGVNRPARHRLGFVPQRLLEPAGDLFGGAIGERDGADAARIDTGADEMLDPSDQAVRLAGARPCNDEHGAEGRFDRATLLRQGGESHEAIILQFQSAGKGRCPIGPPPELYLPTM